MKHSPFKALVAGSSPAQPTFACWGLIGLFLIAASLSAQAALTWEKTDITATAGVVGDEVKAVFPFVNGGTAEVQIEAIHTSCVCTSATSTQKTYAPGEKGTIDVTVRLDDPPGPRQKVITVQTSDAPAQVLHLNLAFLPSGTITILRRDGQLSDYGLKYTFFHKIMGRPGPKIIFTKVCPCLYPFLRSATVDLNGGNRIETIRDGFRDKQWWNWNRLLFVHPQNNAVVVYVNTTSVLINTAYDLLLVDPGFSKVKLNYPQYLKTIGVWVKCSNKQ